MAKIPPLIRLGFQGGAKSSLDPSSVPPNAVWDVVNVRSDESGILRVRTGCKRIAEPLGTGLAQGLSSAFGGLLLAWNRNLYKVDVSTGIFTEIGTGLLGATATDACRMIRWTRNGVETVYLFPGNGIFSTDGTTTSAITPYTPQSGEQANLIRKSDGTLETNSGPCRCRFALLRASLGQRLAAAGDPQSPNTVYLSAPLDATYWPVNQTIQLPDDGGKITGLANWYNALIIFRDRDIWAFFGADVTASDAALVLQDASTGCINGDTIAVLPGIGVAFLGPDNVYAIQGVSGVENQVKSVPLSKDILKHLKIAMSFGTKRANAIYYDNEYRLSFPECTEKRRVFRLSLKHEGQIGWYMDSGPTTSHMVVHDNVLYATYREEAKIVKFNEQLTDDGEPFYLEVFFRREDLQPGPSRIKEIFVYLLSKASYQNTNLFFFGSAFNEEMVGEQETEPSTINIGTEQKLKVQVVVDGQQFIVDDFTVTVGRMNKVELEAQEPVHIYRARFMPSLKGHFAQIRILGEIPEQDMAIIGYGITYSTRGRIHGRRTGVSV